MTRPTRFEHNQYVGDKRTQVVHDIDRCVAETVDELMEAGTYLAFGPYTLVEARTRATSPTRPAAPAPTRSEHRHRAAGLIVDGIWVASGGEHLVGYHADPPVSDGDPPTLVLCHGYPSGMVGSDALGRSDPALADRIANEGWRVVTFTFRGCGASSGDFSLGGWLADILAVAETARTLAPNGGVWLAGFGTGGGLCVAAAARRPEIRGVAVLGSPADFSDWATHPKRLLRHAREVGVITDPDFPPNVDAWTRQLREIKPVDDAARLGGRPLLVLHGSDDESVPSFDARVMSDAHGSAELRIVPGAAHDLRHDPGRRHPARVAGSAAPRAGSRACGLTAASRPGGGRPPPGCRRRPWGARAPGPPTT